MLKKIFALLIIILCNALNASRKPTKNKSRVAHSVATRLDKAKTARVEIVPKSTGISLQAAIPVTDIQKIVLGYLDEYQELHSFPHQQNNIGQLAWSSDNSRIAAIKCPGYNIREIKIFDALRGKIIKDFSLQNEVRSITWSPDGKNIALGIRSHLVSESIAILNSSTGEAINTILCPEATSKIAWSPDSKYIAWGSSDGKVRISSIERNRSIKELIISTDNFRDVESVAWNRTGTYLASGSRNGTLKIFDLITGDNSRTLNNGTVSQILWSHDDTRIFAATETNGALLIWNSSTGEFSKGFTVGGLGMVLLLTPNNRIIVQDGNQHIKILDPATGIWLQTIENTEKFSIHSAALSPNGLYIALGTHKGIIKIFKNQAVELALDAESK